jgi:hypothetical protein
MRNPKSVSESASRRTLLGGFLILCALALFIAGRDIERPGLYYDEVIQAESAVRFLQADPAPHQIPGAAHVRLFGRWLPVMTQPYMGALKSQLLIPAFAVFGSGAGTLRLTTLSWSLVGLLFLMLWTRRELGLSTALLGGALVILDPSLLLISRHDWGSVAIAFACRCAGLYFASSGWRAKKTWRAAPRLAAAGLFLGLGVYNKIDFALVLVCGGLALFAVRPELARERASAPRLVAFLLGGLLGLAPLIGWLGSAARVARGAITKPLSWVDLLEKWNTWVATLNGSYFHKLVLAGGSFENMYTAEQGAATFFPMLFGASALWLALQWWRQRRRGEFDPARAFVLLLALLIPLSVFLTPRAVRVHHALLAAPFPQLVVAIAVIDLWHTGRPAAVRIAAAAIAGVALLGNLWVLGETLETLHMTGGKGRWSDAIVSFAPELQDRVAVNLDWGLYLPLRFANRELATVEPFWRLREQMQRGHSWTFDGTSDHVYLFLIGKHAVFGYGEALLDAARRLPTERVSIRHHSDRSGDPAFVSLRFATPHRLVYDGTFEVKFAGQSVNSDAARE